MVLETKNKPKIDKTKKRDSSVPVGRYFEKSQDNTLEILEDDNQHYFKVLQKNKQNVKSIYS